MIYCRSFHHQCQWCVYSSVRIIVVYIPVRNNAWPVVVGVYMPIRTDWPRALYLTRGTCFLYFFPRRSRELPGSVAILFFSPVRLTCAQQNTNAAANNHGGRQWYSAITHKSRRVVVWSFDLWDHKSSATFVVDSETDYMIT